GGVRWVQGGAGSKGVGRENVGEFGILILDQRDEARAVRIVFQALDSRRYIEFPATEIDPSVGLLMAAAAEPRGDASVIVTAARRVLTLGQRLDRWALVQGRAIDDHQLALARRHRIVFFQRHRNALLTIPWSHRSGDLPRGSRSRASRRTVARSCCGTLSTCPAA